MEEEETGQVPSHGGSTRTPIPPPPPDAISQITTKAPQPVNRLAYAIFYLQGIGQLFPWNAFITATSYYKSRFCGSSHSIDFENYFSVTYMLANLIMLALMLRFSHSVTASIKARIVYSLVAMSALFLLTMLVVLVRHVDQYTLFFFTNLCTSLCGLLTSVYQGGMFGFAGLFPPIYTQAMMAGQGMGGLVISIASILTSLSSPSSCGGSESQDDCTPYDAIDWSSFAYFAANVVVLVACIASFLVLDNLDITK